MNEKVLSIHFGHNATIGLLDGNKITRILNEEKFDNVKNSTGFPTNAIKYSMLKEKNNINSIILTQKEIFQGVLQLVKPKMVKNNLKKKEIFSTVKIDMKDFIIKGLYKSKLFLSLRSFHQNFTRKENLNLLEFNFKKLGLPLIYSFSEHHISHTFSVITFYGLLEKKEPILIFTLDGTGDQICATVSILKNGKLEVISKTTDVHSLGYLYSTTTKFLGMKPLEHEYKVMGLAAYSKKKYFFKTYEELFRNVLKINEKTLEFENQTNMPMGYFDKILIKKANYHRFDNIAAALQYFTEELVLNWISFAIKKTKIKNVAFSGGVFMNVKLNQKILELKNVKKVWFMPSCGDESNVIGALGYDSYNKNDKIEPVKTMFLGLEFTNNEIKNFLVKNKLENKYKITFHKDIEKEIAKLLFKEKIVARFKGKGEWGARSLCNRALLGNASKLETFFKINDMIKMRDFWMPFAPTILDSWAKKYIIDWDYYSKKCFDSTKYMILTFSSTMIAQKHLRAAIHQKDKTLRPQIVSKEDNEDLYKLLKYYEKLTGMGGFMNTSFNIHGYPLVGNLEQAFFTLENSELKYLALENFLIEKKNSKID